MGKLLLFCFVCLMITVSVQSDAQVDSFPEAKQLLRERVYHDQTTKGTFYCGCKWSWKGLTGGVIDHTACGYKPKNTGSNSRAYRLEWEHVVPAATLGNSLACWSTGGRKNCDKKSLFFRQASSDLFNIVPSVGEVNNLRSDYSYSAKGSKLPPFGNCDVRVDPAAKIVVPRKLIRGRIARITFYMHDKYNILLPSEQETLMLSWHKQYPVTQAEKLIEQRIAAITGNRNEFVTGTKVWTKNYQQVPSTARQ